MIELWSDREGKSKMGSVSQQEAKKLVCFGLNMAETQDRKWGKRVKTVPYGLKSFELGFSLSPMPQRDIPAWMETNRDGHCLLR